MSSRLFQRVREELGLAYSFTRSSRFHDDRECTVCMSDGARTARAASTPSRRDGNAGGDGISEDDLTAGKTS
jgi:hypothetical protein